MIMYAYKNVYGNGKKIFSFKKKCLFLSIFGSLAGFFVAKNTC